MPLSFGFQSRAQLDAVGSSFADELDDTIATKIILRVLQAGEAYVSTLAVRDDRMVNPLWKLRLPLPAFPDWEKAAMPAARVHREGEGLCLWTRYMNPARLAEIHASVQDAMAEDEQKTVAHKVAGREEARADMELNPGYRM